MNKQNDTDFDLQFRDDDAFADDLRAALRRREERRPTTDVPDDFLDRVMVGIEADPVTLGIAPAAPAADRSAATDRRRHRARRVALAVLAAASVALAVMMVWPVSRPTEQGLLHDSPRTFAQSATDSCPIGHGLLPNRPRTFAKSATDFFQIDHGLFPKSPNPITKKSTANRPKVRARLTKSPRPIDQSAGKGGMDDYLSELERGLADVGDSCYLAQVERMIAHSPELQQIMNTMTHQQQ